MDWTEDWVRGQAGWQAFREGKGIYERESVSGFKRRGALLTGAFKVGRKTLRTVVRGEEPMSVECACEENRASGAVCAHGVALLLTAIRLGAEPEARETKPVPAVRGPLFAARITLPAGFATALAQGRLSVRIDEAGEELQEADAAFSLWLARQSLAPDFPRWLALDDQTLPGFFDALQSHPRLLTDRGLEVEVASDPLPALRLASSELRDDRVFLQLQRNADISRSPIAWGEELGWVMTSGQRVRIGRAPLGDVTRAWRNSAAGLIEKGRLELQKDEFLGRLDAWLDLFESPLPGWLGELRFEAAPLEVVLEIEGSLNALDATARFRYPGSSLHPLGKGPAVIDGLPALGANGALRMRSPREERAAADRLTGTGFVPGSGPAQFRLRDPDAILAFVADELPALRAEWTVTLGERLAEILKSVHVIRPHLGFDASLAVDLSFQTDAGKKVPRSRIQEILRGGKRSATTSNGARVIISREIPDLIEPLLADLGVVHPEGRIALNRAQNLLLRSLRKNQSDTFSIKHLFLQAPATIPVDFPVPLRDYQRQGFQWLADRLEGLKGALLADEMGLGKTVQTIALIVHLRSAGEMLRPALILVPATLIGNWQEELSKFAPKLGVVTLHGPGRDALRSEVGAADCIVTSYGTLVRDLAFHLQQDYSLLVADEASLLRNPDSEISRSVAKLRAARRLALTGTPMENRVGDLWSIFRIIAPGYLGAKKDFLERYDSSFSAESGPGLQRRLGMRISPFVLRRTKAEVARDLPEKLVIDEWLDFGAEDQAIYSGMARAGLESLDGEGKGGGRVHLLTLLMRLRQFCLEPRLVDRGGDEDWRGAKSKRLTEMLSERGRSGSKTLVFSQFREYLRFADSKALEDWGRVFLLDGSTRDRGRLVREFQEYPGPAVFLISLKAGGYGLNLTAADTVIHMDPWWNPSAEAQASDRVHRIGQTNPVTIFRMLMRNSVEERVRRLQISKQAMIDAVQGEGEALPGNWSDEDLRGLVG